MNNNYETAEALVLGQAQHAILGMKVIDPFFCDDVMGCGWRWDFFDIDETDE